MSTLQILDRPKTVRDIAREIYSESGEPDRYKLIDDLIVMIHEYMDVEDALRELVRMATPQWNAAFRTEAWKALGRTEVERTPRAGSADDAHADFDGTEQVTANTDTKQRTAQVSPRLARYVKTINTRWANFLNQGVSGEGNRRILMADMERRDVVANIARRATSAEALKREQANWENLLDVFDRAGVERFGDLSPSEDILKLELNS